ncbi:hypothetical protein DVH24_009299 [Malus domestica]|uniref:Uncharacterized protein n=1 Tax=Malus domestica TaxID=3750 RepID=A0A498IPP5_MALDO|nr:hypothetical protein DVH24_009299 [Malus domestica]
MWQVIFCPIGDELARVVLHTLANRLKNSRVKTKVADEPARRCGIFFGSTSTAKDEYSRASLGKNKDKENDREKS